MKIFKKSEDRWVVWRFKVFMRSVKRGEVGPCKGIGGGGREEMVDRREVSERVWRLSVFRGMVLEGGGSSSSCSSVRTPTLSAYSARFRAGRTSYSPF